MIADSDNVPKAVYLDGKPLDLHLVTMADDERGIVETLVTERDEFGHLGVKTGLLGQPIIKTLRGDVRIIPRDIPGKPH